MTLRAPTSRTLLAAAACVIAAACAPAPPPDAAPAPVVIRLDASDIANLAMLLRMEDTRTLDTLLVARLLADPLPEVRGRAALAAGRVRDTHAATLLVGAAADPDAAVRARVAFALGQLGDSSAVVVAALARLADDAPGPAREAAAAVGRLGPESGRQILESLLDAPATPAAVRQEALLAVWRLPRTPSSMASVLRWTDAAAAETRWRAVYALMRLGGTAAVPALLAALDDPDERSRANAARGLRAPLTDSAGVRPAAFDALLAAAADPHPHVRINALRMLPQYRDNARSLPVLLARLRDDDANTAVAAAQTLGETGDPAAAAALRAVAVDGAAPLGLRTVALGSWLRLDPAGSVPVAAAWADSAAWLLRYHAARTLDAAPWAEAAGTLERLARDTSPLVSAAALGALRTAADSLPALRRIYMEQLAAAAPLVRAAALRGLARQVTAADLDLLLNAYERARHDPTRDAAMAAVDALGRLVRDGVPAERAFFARFGPLGPPADAVLHRAIVDRIGAPPAAWGAPAAQLARQRPSGFYVDIVERLVAPVLAGEPAPRVAIDTEHGPIVLELASADAPLTVHNFLSLVERGYYAGTRWHRVVPNFVIQDGDPRGDGSGGPGYAIRDEINELRYLRGALGMALSGPDTGGSQFFITHSPQPHLDGGYTIFGRVVDWLDVVDRVVQEEPINGFRRLH